MFPVSSLVVPVGWYDAPKIGVFESSNVDDMNPILSWSPVLLITGYDPVRSSWILISILGGIVRNLLWVPLMIVLFAPRGPGLLTSLISSILQTLLSQFPVLSGCQNLHLGQIPPPLLSP